MLVSWNDHFALGIAIVDSGHGLVIETINELNDASAPADSAAVAGRMLPLLHQHLRDQFAAERSLMAGLDAATRQGHEDEHRRILDTLDFLQRGHDSGHNVAGPLLLNLVCFLLSHLRATDADCYAPRRFHPVAA